MGKSEKFFHGEKFKCREDWGWKDELLNGKNINQQYCNFIEWIFNAASTSSLHSFLSSSMVLEGTFLGAQLHVGGFEYLRD